MARMKTYHVECRDDEQWQVKAEQNSRATSLHATKREAVARAQALASNQKPSQVIVHHVEDEALQSEYIFALDDAA